MAAMLERLLEQLEGEGCGERAAREREEGGEDLTWQRPSDPG